MKEELEEVDVRHYCRICFEEKPNLIPSQKVLVLEDFTCTVEEILLLLSAQEVRAYPTYPTKICSTCKELVEATFALKIMYEKTSEVLRKLLSPIEEEILKIKIEPEKNGNSEGTLEWDEELNSFYENSHTEETKFDIELFNADENNIDTEEETNQDHPEYYEIDKENDYPGENSQTDEENDNIEDNYEDLDTEEEHSQIDVENTQIEAKKEEMEEEEIILEIEEPVFGLSRNEKRNLYRKRKRYLEKQQTISMGEQIEKEIEQTINSSKIKLKKPESFTHICPICYTEQVDPMEFRKHIRTHRVLKKCLRGKPLPQNCRIVAQPRNIVTIFNKPDAVHWCPYCNESLPALKFGIHLWNHERMDEFYCNKCDRTFYKLRDYNLHTVRSHREEYPFKCDICHQGFVIKYNFDCHMLKHNSKEEDLPYACEECPRKFSNSVHLWRHMHIHNGKGVYGSQYKKYRCPKCREHFHTVRAYDVHECTETYAQHTSGKIEPKKNVAVGQRKDYSCRVCGKPFKTYTGVYQHVRKTHEKKHVRKICEICGKAVYNFTAHMNSHTGQKQPPRVCDICGKSFTTVANYFRHRKTLHSDKVPYLCDVCGKAFKHYDSFKTHERIHIGNKCHKCPVCGKGFLEKSYMKKHLITHSKSKRIYFEYT